MPSLEVKDAPLVEIIAELQWDSHRLNSPAQAFLSNDVEGFYVQFGGEVYQHGYRRVDRTIPPGFPVPNQQPVYRYRLTDNDKVSAKTETLYQLGPGIFSANGLPPYKDWDEFSPIIERGVKALLESRPQKDKEIPFKNLNLRYINAFKQKLLDGKTPRSFMEDVLGFSLAFPKFLERNFLTDEEVKPFFQTESVLKNKMHIKLAVGHAEVNGEKACLLDYTVIDTRGVNPNSDEIMSRYTEQHEILRNLFVEITHPIHKLMGLRSL